MPGKDFDVVAFSIDPVETSELAGKKKASYLERYDRTGTESGWHFLTGDASSIETLTRAIGFRYTYNPQTKLYAHAAGIIIVTPDGRTARYFFGIDYPAKELQYELERARAGKGQLADQPAAPALLRLRRGHGQIYAVDPAPDSRPWDCDGRGAGQFLIHHVPSRAPESPGVATRGCG